MSLESPLARLVFQIGLKVTVSQIIKELALGLLGFLKDLISQVVRSAAKAQEPHSSPWLQGWVARVATSLTSWLCHFKWGSWSIGGAVECPPASFPILWVLCCVWVLLNTSLRPLLFAYSPLPHALTLWPLPSPFDPCPHPLPSGPCPKEALPHKPSTSAHWVYLPVFFSFFFF